MIKPLSTALKSLLLCTTLAASALAFALPAPKDIETAVSQGHLTQAESMLREVIAAKPHSAKAHYELGQVLLRENRASEAHAELSQAQSIDPSLKFASSDKQFKDLLERSLDNTRPAQALGNSTSHQSTAQSDRGFSLTYVWIGIAGLALMALLIRMNRPTVQAMPTNYTGPAPAPSTAYPGGNSLSTAFGRMPSSAYPPAPTGYPANYPAAAPSGGSNVAGAVIGGLAGVAAGYALSKALEGDHHPAAGSVPNNNSWADNQGLVSAAPSSAPPLETFDAGTGDDWGDDNGASSDDDTW